MTNHQNSSRTIFFVLATVVAGFVLCLGVTMILMARDLFVYIKPDERGIVISMGQPTGEVLEPGSHFIVPGQKMVIIYIGQQTYVTGDTSTESPDFLEVTTSDGQKIQVDVSAVYAVDQEQIVNLYIVWGDHYPDGFVRPAIRVTTRSILEQYPLAEILQNQAEIEQIAFDELEQMLEEQGLILVEYKFLDICEITLEEHP